MLRNAQNLVKCGFERVFGERSGSARKPLGTRSDSMTTAGTAYVPRNKTDSVDVLKICQIQHYLEVNSFIR